MDEAQVFAKHATRDTGADAPTVPRVQQPKPQALPARSGPSSILVSPRQKGNPILNGIRALPWEYSDIVPDYVVGLTTCVLFLSLKYHRLHPEYIYSRIKALGGKYNLRILLTMVDIQNHEEALKELSKTSLINNVTIILCWTAQEAARYLELFKSYEHAAPTSIKAHQSTTYSEKLVDFITVPRSINKTDAVGLVSSFGSLRTAINARSEEVSLVAGWGEKKVQRWCSTVREDFRMQRASKRRIARDDSQILAPSASNSVGGSAPTANESNPMFIGGTSAADNVYGFSNSDSPPAEAQLSESDKDDEQALLESRAVERMHEDDDRSGTRTLNNGMSEGISAALERFRRQG